MACIINAFKIITIDMGIQVYEGWNPHATASCTKTCFASSPWPGLQLLNVLTEQKLDVWGGSDHHDKKRDIS